MKEKSSLTNSLLHIAQILPFAILGLLFLPALNPMRYFTLISDWNFSYFLGHSMEIDRVFTAAYPGVRELFANNALMTFCGYLMLGCSILTILGIALTLLKKTKLKSIGLLLMMIFSVIIMVSNVMIWASVFGANSKIQSLNYSAMGMSYMIPVGTFIFFILAAAEFFICLRYRKHLIMDKGLYRKMSRAERIENRKGYAFISLYLIGFVCWTFIPLAFSIFSSFTYYNITAVQKWYGIQNFTKLFTDDPDFWKSLYNTFWYVIFSVPLNLAASLGLALLMNMEIKWKRFFRTMYYLPSVLSGIAVYLLWQWVFDPYAGLLNSALRVIGIDGPNWLFNPATTKPAMLIMSIWGVGGVA